MTIKLKNMNIKFLYALGLLLCLSTVASSNECTRFFHRTSGKGCSATSPCDAAAPTLSAAPTVSAEPTLSASSDATSETDHAPSLTLIKLLYI
jgi:hypothetical protein